MNPRLVQPQLILRLVSADIPYMVLLVVAGLGSLQFKQVLGNQALTSLPWR